MSSDMECYLLVYPGSQYPPLYGFVGTRWEYMSPNTLSFGLPLLPMSSAACGVMSRYSSPPVFFCLKMIRVYSPCSCTSPHVSFSMSLRRSPVRYENKESLFDVWIFAFGLRQLLQFVNGKVHSRSLLGLKNPLCHVSDCGR